MAVNYNDGNWHGWGGEYMKPAIVHDKSIVEFIWHDENTDETGKDQMQAGWNDIDERPAWSNVLKFRVIKEYREPREFWIEVETGRATTEPCHANHFYVHVREVIE